MILAVYSTFFSKNKSVPFFSFLEEIIPEIVHINDGGYKSISYDKLAAVLVEAIKELKAENETLKEANKTLKKEIDKIKEVIGL